MQGKAQLALKNWKNLFGDQREEWMNEWMNEVLFLFSTITIINEKNILFND